MKKLIVILGVVIIFIIILTGLSKEKLFNEPFIMKNTQTENKVVILQTNKGNISIELFFGKMPITSGNFIKLVKEGFYDNTKFHRVIKDFMIQGGDPNGDGTGGPGYTFADEPIKRDYKRGIVAMANRGPDSNGSQYFIMHKDKPDLSKLYVIFGQVTSGMETVDKIATAETIESGAEKSTPLKPVKITKVTIKES